MSYHASEMIIQRTALEEVTTFQNWCSKIVTGKGKDLSSAFFEVAWPNSNM